MKKLLVLVCVITSIHISYAQKDRIYYNLEAAYKKPDSIFHLTYSEYWYRFDKFPDDLDKFKNLKSLYLNNVILDTFPDCICNLKNLEVLTIGELKIETLPKCLKKLPNLKELTIHKGTLKDISIISELLNLEKVLITKNEVDKLPQFKSANKYKLESLDLSNNNIEAINKDVNNLKSLKALIIPYNNITEVSAGLFEIESLEVLNLSSNNLKNISFNQTPKKLKVLDVSNDLNYFGELDNENQFTDFSFIYHFKNLEKLNIGNAFKMNTLDKKFKNFVNLKELSLSPELEDIYTSFLDNSSLEIIYSLIKNNNLEIIDFSYDDFIYETLYGGQNQAFNTFQNEIKDLLISSGKAITLEYQSVYDAYEYYKNYNTIIKPSDVFFRYKEIKKGLYLIKKVSIAFEDDYDDGSSRFTKNKYEYDINLITPLDNIRIENLIIVEDFNNDNYFDFKVYNNGKYNLWLYSRSKDEFIKNE